MKDFFAEFSNYKLLYIMLIGLIVLTVFMFIKAGKAVKRSNARKEELMKRLDRMKMLKENYSDLTVEKIKNDESDLLVEGIATMIQRDIEKSDDMNETFERLNEEQKTIYALNWFIEDGKKSVREFFRQYSRPLTPYVVKAFDMFGPAEARKDLKRMFDMYDDENEGVSLFEEEAEKLESNLMKTIDFDMMNTVACEYVRHNAEKFV